MFRITSISFCIILLFFISDLYSQELPEHKEQKHKISVMFGYTHIPKGIKNETKGVFAPTLGFEYEYEFNHKWAAGLVGDIEFLNYSVDFDDELVPRENVIVIAALAFYKLTDHFQVYLGPGYEIEQNKQHFVVRSGLKYIIELNEKFDLAPLVEFDFKEEYETVTAGFTVGMKL